MEDLLASLSALAGAGSGSAAIKQQSAQPTQLTQQISVNRSLPPILII